MVPKMVGPAGTHSNVSNYSPWPRLKPLIRKLFQSRQLSKTNEKYNWLKRITATTLQSVVNCVGVACSPSNMALAQPSAHDETTVSSLPPPATSLTYTYLIGAAPIPQLNALVQYSQIIRTESQTARNKWQFCSSQISKFVDSKFA